MHLLVGSQSKRRRSRQNTEYRARLGIDGSSEDRREGPEGKHSSSFLVGFLDNCMR